MQWREIMWIPGCYGLNKPATLVASNVVVWRKRQNGVEILVGRRGAGRWESGYPILAHGGFIDPGESPLDAAKRELKEEIPGIDVKIEELPFLLSKSDGFRYKWDPSNKESVKTYLEVQNIPVVTIFYWGKYISGSPKTSEEVDRLEWKSVSEITNSETEWAFCMAECIPEMIKKFK